MTDIDNQPKFWIGPVGEKDDFGQPIENEFYDAKTKFGPWAMMSPVSFQRNAATTQLGTGLGQRYERQLDGRWLKVGG